LAKVSPCIVCDNSKYDQLYAGLIKCTNCGHVVADHSYTDEQLRELYKKKYFFGDEYVDYLADEKALRKNFQLRLKSLLKYTGTDVNKVLLEVGSAYGFFLAEAKSYFADIVGIDITEDGVEYTKKILNLEAKLVELLDFKPSGNIDIGCMWDTIEHLKNPHKYIEKLSNITKKNGLLALTTGDLSSVLARIRKDRWRLIHPPTHIHYFTKNSIEILLNKYEYKIIHFEYCGFYRSLSNSLYNILVLRHKQQWLYNLLVKMNFDFVYYLNTYDIMYIIAQKQ
jgi:SAM-dependent methyltransferase